MDECCCQSAPPALSIARAVSVLTVRVYQINSPTFAFPFFCGRRFFRQCNLVATDNGRCAIAQPALDAQGTIPIFAATSSGNYDPCVALGPVAIAVAPFTFADSVMTCRLAPSGSDLDCWDATYTLSIETTINDLIAACLSNLALIDLNTVPFDRSRLIVNSPINGAPGIVGDFTLSETPGLPDAACAAPSQQTLAASLAVRFAGPGVVSHCTNTRDRLIQMPTHTIIVSASRSRFTVNSTWCKRTRTPILTDPDFITGCKSTPGACAETACAHYNAASGVIDVPTLNQSILLGLCSAPAAPCNASPIAF